LVVLGNLVLLTVLIGFGMVVVLREMLTPKSHMFESKRLFELIDIGLLRGLVVRVSEHLRLVGFKVFPDREGGKKDAVLHLLLETIAKKIAKTVRVKLTTYLSKVISSVLKAQRVVIYKLINSI
jgi:hypothetical protein